MTKTLRAVTTTALLFASSAALVDAQVVVTLNNTFIEQYRNRVTITANYTVDKAHPKPNPVAKDADMHVAGRAPEIGLPTVAEIMNAIEDQAAVDKIHEVEGTAQGIRISGAWRIWPEHGGQDDQVQGDKIPKITTTNPPHVFEIHPITRVGTIATSTSIHFIGTDFQTKDASASFTAFENHRCTLSFDAADGTTTIETPMIGDNYVEFAIELNESPRKVADGYMVYAKVYTTDGELLVHNRRMVFIDGTKEADLVKGLGAGSQLHVLGIPRIDLALVYYRTHPTVQNQRDKKRSVELLTWNLPYEMVIVGAEAKPFDSGAGK